MYFKALATAAALTLGAVSANAATFGIADGDSYDITSDNFFNGIVQAEGGAGSFTVNFFTDKDPLKGTADLSINAGNLTGFTDLTVAWETEDNTADIVGPVDVVVGDLLLSTVFTGTDLSQDLVFTWSDSSAGAGFDVSVSAVPLPAGAVLLGSALLGLGIARRRRAAA